MTPVMQHELRFWLPIFVFFLLFRLHFCNSRLIVCENVLYSRQMIQREGNDENRTIAFSGSCQVEKLDEKKTADTQWRTPMWKNVAAQGIRSTGIQ